MSKTLEELREVIQCDECGNAEEVQYTTARDQQFIAVLAHFGMVFPIRAVCDNCVHELLLAHRLSGTPAQPVNWIKLTIEKSEKET